jgi:ZIP family zinc transporter
LIDWNLVATATGASAVAGVVATSAGALPVLAVRKISPKLEAGFLGFAAGAMLWVVSSEIIPETHINGRQNSATAALMVGPVLMPFLDWTLG